VTIRSYSGPLSFSHTTISGGGDPSGIVPEAASMLDVHGDGTLPTQGVIHADHLTVRGSASQGILLSPGAGFTADSTALTVTESATAPLSVYARAVGALPTGTYTGNGVDEIVIPGVGGTAAVLEDTTMRALGVPYHVGTPGTSGTLSVGGVPGSVATLTIEPGVTLRFDKDGIFYVEVFSSTDPPTGALVAAGTADEPIVFTSAEAAPQAGDWLGIYFGSAPDPGNVIDHAEVRYAGGLSGTGSFSCTNAISDGRSEAAIRILGGAPTHAFVTNTLIADSAGYGFDLGWTGDPIDFKPTNTFENLAWCPQTEPIPPALGCSGVTVDCP
jgi:hypothetical protein